MTDQADDNPRPWCPICSKTLFPPVTFVLGYNNCHSQCVSDAVQDMIEAQSLAPEVESP